MDIVLKMDGARGAFIPELIGEVSWTTELYGAGILEYSVLKAGTADFKEGDPVELTAGGVPLFGGTVFTKKRTEEGIISVTAYDSMRYLKNRDSYTFSGKKASQIVRMICDDYRLNVGQIADTGFVLPTRVEDNSTLFDIIYNALDTTAAYTGKSYLLYDSVGALSLQPLSYFDTNLLVDNETAIGFDYKTTIDRDVYNSVKLIHSASKNKVVTDYVYTAKDEGLMKDYGVLQYFRHIDGNTNGAVLARGILDAHKTKVRELCIKTLGCTALRAGSGVKVNMDIGDFILNDFMRVKKCVHTFCENEHFTQLTLTGGQLSQ